MNLNILINLIAKLSTTQDIDVEGLGSFNKPNTETDEIKGKSIFLRIFYWFSGFFSYKNLNQSNKSETSETFNSNKETTISFDDKNKKTDCESNEESSNFSSTKPISSVNN
ncbi:hypothetical protein A0H76_19 [Hepatospora eriocheir]|uniref:Uncharacterized protein n=1 Tax=Hepatospora eriocheir TaxID=1081669 RepID=A0A1X0QLM7_9MICR|nr:hypothetical protein A0H76_19 [Hepatospora eriocheir]